MSSEIDFQIIVISPPKNLAKEQDTLCKLFEAGLNTFHLRKPTFTSQEMKAYLDLVPRKYHPRIVIHSRYELAETYILKGIHLTEQKRKTVIKTDTFSVISTSFHQLDDYRLNQKDYEYVFISPVFNSISKSNYSSNFKLEELNLFLNEYKHNTTIALGGICIDNILNIKSANFDGAAMIGCIWHSDDPVVAFLELMKKIRE